MLPVLVWLAVGAATPVFTNRAPASPPATRRSSDCALRVNTTAGGDDLLLVYGGFNGGTLSDFPGYRVGVNTWGLPVTAAAPARERHAMAWDALHDVIAVVGGGNGFTVYDAVQLVGPTNVLTTPTLPALRPTARIDALLLWIPPLQRFLYFGGASNVFGTAHSNDLWTLDVADGGVGWTQLPAPSGVNPSGRGAVCAAWDPDHALVLVFGGETNGPNFSNELFTFPIDGGTWGQPATTGTPPTARAFAACEWDRVTKQLIVYGGQGSGGPLPGLYGFDPATRVWTTYAPATSPGALSDSAAAFSPQLNGILFFGGRSAATTYTNATWLLRFNSPPVVDGGPNQTVNEGTLVTLAGSYVDPDLDPVTTTWGQSGGPAVTLNMPNALNATFTAPSVTQTTVLTMHFSASDGFAGVGTDVTITVLNSINDVPVAFAGPDQTVDAGATVTLSGVGTDPNMDPLTYGWSQIAGPTVTLINASAAVATFVAPSPTVSTGLAFRLVVNDGMALSLPDDVLVTVNPVPFVDAGVDAGTPDAGTPDAGTPDAGTPDAGTPDAGTPDAGIPDAGTPDAGTPDAGTPDAGTPDAGTPDAGTPDAGTPDAGAPDAGGADAGVDAGTIDAGASDLPRTLGVGCGCSEVPGAFALLALLALGRRRAVSACRR